MLVCSKSGSGLLQVRMALVAGCWAAGVRAELVPRACPSLTEQYEFAAARGIRWLVGRGRQGGGERVTLGGKGGMLNRRVFYKVAHEALAVCVGESVRRQEARRQGLV